MRYRWNAGKIHTGNVKKKIQICGKPVPHHHHYHFSHLNGFHLYSLFKGNSHTITRTKIIENNWVKDGKVNDRSILGDDFKAYCAEYPIYFVKKVEDFSTTVKDSNRG